MKYIIIYVWHGHTSCAATGLYYIGTWESDGYIYYPVERGEERQDDQGGVQSDASEMGWLAAGRTCSWLAAGNGPCGRNMAFGLASFPRN